MNKFEILLASLKDELQELRRFHSRYSERYKEAQRDGSYLDADEYSYAMMAYNHSADRLAVLIKNAEYGAENLETKNPHCQWDFIISSG